MHDSCRAEKARDRPEDEGEARCGAPDRRNDTREARVCESKKGSAAGEVVVVATCVCERGRRCICACAPQHTHTDRHTQRARWARARAYMCIAV